MKGNHIPPPQIPSHFPSSINRLWEVAHNLWWSWHPEARALFETLDRTLWKLTSHNPVRLLRELSLDRAVAAAADPSFHRRYDAVLLAFDDYMEARDTWFARTHPELADSVIAYFSAEFGLHHSIPIYSGGLGVLAGDHCKEASDLGVPLVGIGFLYPQGYFHQRISADGWQQAWYEPLAFGDAPIRPSVHPNGERVLIQVPLDGRTIDVSVWQVAVGRVSLYLMDTDVESNPPWDRELSARLYGGDQENRILQEIVLGIGGVRVVRALGLRPAVWHANEGHAAFLMLERLREHREAGLSFEDAVQAVRASTIFTTHTPVSAGHDAFPLSLMEKYFTPFCTSLSISREQFMQFGFVPGSNETAFNMTVLALQLSGHRNAVSRRHGETSRQMWSHLWPGTPPEEVPIVSVTNGVHVPTWVAPEMRQLYAKYLGPDWVAHHNDPALWERVADIPDGELWNTRLALKLKLLGHINEGVRRRWIHGQLDPSQVLASGTLLQPQTLTIGFARRFATYKRATLIFHDLERLKRLLQDPWRACADHLRGKGPSGRRTGKVFHSRSLLTSQGSRDRRPHRLRRRVRHAHRQVPDPRLGCLAEYASITARGVWYQRRKSGAQRRPASQCAGRLVGRRVQRGEWMGDRWTRLQPGPGCAGRSRCGSLVSNPGERGGPAVLRSGCRRGAARLARVVRETIRSAVPRFCARRMVQEYTEKLYVPASQQSLSRR